MGGFWKGWKGGWEPGSLGGLWDRCACCGVILMNNDDGFVISWRSHYIFPFESGSTPHTASLDSRVEFFFIQW